MNTNVLEVRSLRAFMMARIKFRLLTILSAFVLFAAAANVQRLDAQPSPRVEERGFVYTADERGNSVSVIDLSTGEVKTVPVRISPHNVQISRDGRLLLVVGMLAGSNMSDGQSNAEKRGHAAMQRGRLLIFDAQR